MKNSLKKCLLVSLLSLLFLSLCCGIMTFTSQRVKAESPLSEDFKMTGASIMLVPDGENGAIRFEVQCSEADYELIGGGATSGMLILPTRFLSGEELELNKTYGEKNPRVKEIDEFWVKNGDVYTAYVYMYGIPEDEYNTYLTARAYFTVDGTTYYSDTVDRSIAYVASTALAVGGSGLDDCCMAIVDKVIDSTFAFEQAEYEVNAWEYFTAKFVNDQGLTAKFAIDNENVGNDGGILRASKEGTSTLTAKIGSKEATATVKVNKSPYETFEAEDLSQSTSIAKGKTQASFVYKSVNNYGGHGENLGLSIKANEYIQIAKPINFISAGNMFTKMWFNEMTADEYKGTTLNLLFTSIGNAEKRFVVKLRIDQDGFVYTSILGGDDFNYQYEVKNPTSQVGTASGYINIRTNVGGNNATHQIDNSYAFMINDIAEYGDMYLTVFADKDVKVAFDYFGDALYSNYMTGYDALPTLAEAEAEEKFAALTPSIATELVATNLYAKGSTVNSFAYKNTSHPTVYGSCLGINLKANEWITISEEHTNIANGWTSFVFNDMTADEYKGTTLTMVFVSKADSTKKAAIEFYIDQNGNITLTNVYGGSLSAPIGCGVAGAEATFDVVSNVGAATAYQIRNRGAFTMPSLGDSYVSFTTDKDIKFSLSYFNDARRWNEAETAVYLGYDVLVKYDWTADAIKDAAKLANATPLDSSTFGGEIAMGTNENTFVYATDNVNYMGIQIGEGEELTFAQTVSYKAAGSTYMIRSYFDTMPDGTELTFTFISKADSTKRFLFTAHFNTSGNYVTLAGVNLDPGDQRAFTNPMLFQVNSSLDIQLDFGGFIVSDDITTMGEMILVISSNTEINFKLDYLNDSRPWQSGYNALTDYASHIA